MTGISITPALTATASTNINTLFPDHEKPKRISIFVETTNPFDGREVSMILNNPTIPGSIIKEIPDITINTSGKYWHRNNSNSVLRVDFDNDRWLSLVDEVWANIINSRVEELFPEIHSDIDSSDEKIMELLMINEKYDYIYTIFHELSHTRSVANFEDTIMKISTLVARSKNIELKSKKHHDIYTSIKESIADIGSIIYMINHGYLNQADGVDFIDSLILIRDISLPYNDVGGLVLGDSTHDTGRFLRGLRDVMVVDINSIHNIDDLEIIHKSMDIIFKEINKS